MLISKVVMEYIWSCIHVLSVGTVSLYHCNGDCMTPKFLLSGSLQKTLTDPKVESKLVPASPFSPSLFVSVSLFLWTWAPTILSFWHFLDSWHSSYISVGFPLLFPLHEIFPFHPQCPWKIPTWRLIFWPKHSIFFSLALASVWGIASFLPCTLSPSTKLLQYGCCVVLNFVFLEQGFSV